MSKDKQENKQEFVVLQRIQQEKDEKQTSQERPIRNQAIITGFRPANEKFSLDDVVIEEVNQETYNKIEGQIKHIIEYFKVYDGLANQTFLNEQKEYYSGKGTSRLFLDIPMVKNRFTEIPPVIQMVVDVYASDANMINKKDLIGAQQSVEAMQKFLAYGKEIIAEAEEISTNAIKQSKDATPAKHIKAEHNKGMEYLEFLQQFEAYEQNNELKKSIKKGIDQLYEKEVEVKELFQSIQSTTGINFFYLIDVEELENLHHNFESAFKPIGLLYNNLATAFDEQVTQEHKQYWEEKIGVTEKRTLVKTKQLPPNLVAQMWMYSLQDDNTKNV